MTDNELVKRYKQGDESAFTELYNRYQLYVTRLINKRINDWERAKEIKQETFIRVHKHIHKFREGGGFHSWILTIANNLAYNELRDRSRNVRGHTVYNYEDRDICDTFEDGRLDQHEALVLKETRQMYIDKLSKLSEIHKTILTLRDINELSYEEIATKMKCNVGTVKSRINRARRNLQELP